MGYRVEYGQTMVKTTLPNRKKWGLSRKHIIWAVGCFLLLLAVHFGRMEKVQNLFLPGDSAVTRSALSHLVMDLEAGKPFADSITAFCREIVENANIPQ